jgi:hypothetical protein
MNVSTELVVNINLAISCALVALIWIVQLIIYPGFQKIPSNKFSAYHRWYVKRISTIVLPLMLVELWMSAWWLKSGSTTSVPAISAFIVFIVWLSTFAIQVPIHKHLTSGKDEVLIRRLILSNWIRTLAWSTKAAVLVVTVIIIES